MDLAALRGDDQFHEMFRRTEFEFFGILLLEANYISSDNSPIFVGREHKRESLARPGRRASRQIGWILPSAIVDISAPGVGRLLILLLLLILFELPQASRSRATPLFFFFLSLEPSSSLSNLRGLTSEFTGPRPRPIAPSPREAAPVQRKLGAGRDYGFHLC